MKTRIRRLVFFTAVAALALLGTGADCKKRRDIPADPMPPVGPDSTWVGVPTTYQVTTTIGGDLDIRYAMNWGGMVDTTEEGYQSGETAAVAHTWMAAGEAAINVQALNAGDPTKASDWSGVKFVKVIANGAPILDQFGSPPIGVRGIEGDFPVIGHDPDGDSIRFRVDWGDSSDTRTAFSSSPCSLVFSHTYTSTGTFTLVALVEDIHGAVSEPESLSLVVGTAGGVIWLWEGKGWTSALVASDGSEECLYCSVEEYPGDQPILRALGAAGGVKHRYGGVAALVEEPACCASTGHIIIGGDGGEFYALEMDLDEAWSWFETEWQRWGPMAMNGARVYLETDYDEAYYFVDSITSGVRIAEFRPAGHQTGAPVIDVQGDVYFGTDSGHLYKMDPDFSAPIWRARLQDNGRIYGPIIGSDGTIYCTTDSLYLFAIDPATGTTKWKIVLDGEGPRPALGSSALLVGTLSGKVYSVDPATGVVNWQKQLSPSYPFETTPIVAADGYAYFQNSADVLYCINQADGTVIWSCDCPRYLPRSSGGHARRAWPADNAPNPSILSNGNIIVVGTDALYCVAGYPERPLDPTAPWPKWQHDKHNTGYVGGGR